MQDQAKDEYLSSCPAEIPIAGFRCSTLKGFERRLDLKLREIDDNR